MCKKTRTKPNLVARHDSSYKLKNTVSHIQVTQNPRQQGETSQYVNIHALGDVLKLFVLFKRGYRLVIIISLHISLKIEICSVAVQCILLVLFISGFCLQLFQLHPELKFRSSAFCPYEAICNAYMLLSTKYS